MQQRIEWSCLGMMGSLDFLNDQIPLTVSVPSTPPLTTDASLLCWTVHMYLGQKIYPQPGNAAHPLQISGPQMRGKWVYENIHSWGLWILKIPLCKSITDQADSIQNFWTCKKVLRKSSVGQTPPWAVLKSQQCHKGPAIKQKRWAGWEGKKNRGEKEKLQPVPLGHHILDAKFSPVPQIGWQTYPTCTSVGAPSLWEEPGIWLGWLGRQGFEKTPIEGQCKKN